MRENENKRKIREEFITERRAEVEAPTNIERELRSLKRWQIFFNILFGVPMAILLGGFALAVVAGFLRMIIGW